MSNLIHVGTFLAYCALLFFITYSSVNGIEINSYLFWSLVVCAFSMVLTQEFTDGK